MIISSFWPIIPVFVSYRPPCIRVNPFPIHRFVQLAHRTFVTEHRILYANHYSVFLKAHKIAGDFLSKID